jgi:hypothetical protein
MRLFDDAFGFALRLLAQTAGLDLCGAKQRLDLGLCRQTEALQRFAQGAQLAFASAARVFDSLKPDCPRLF